MCDNNNQKQLIGAPIDADKFILLLDTMIEEEQLAISKCKPFDWYQRGSRANNKYCLTIVKYLVEQKFGGGQPASQENNNKVDQPFNRAIELLRDLADIQNGPPLVQYEKQWNEIMENVYEFLNIWETDEIK